MVDNGITSVYIRTLCLMHKEKSYEELFAQANNPLYTDEASKPFNLNAGINYVINKDDSGYSSFTREEQEENGYLDPNALKLCRSFPDLYSMKLPLNTSAFKVLGKSVKKARVADFKPLSSVEGFVTSDRSNGASLSEYVYQPDTNGNQVRYFPICPDGGTWEIPFSMKIKHPTHLRWDVTHRRLTLAETYATAESPKTSGPQNYTPFLATHLFSENPLFYRKQGETVAGLLNKLVKIQYNIYVTLDAQPSL